MTNNNYYISTVTYTDADYHRSKIIIHKPLMFYFAEFDTMEQLQFFADTLGFTFEMREERPQARHENGVYREYNISHKIIDDNIGKFWKLSDLPEGVKPFKALSNGSIVTCYFLNDGETITIYRPNPNAEKVYKPLEIQEHIAHKKIYGCY